MPEHSPKPFAEELVADEHGTGVPDAPQQVGSSAVEARPAARQGQASGHRCVVRDRFARARDRIAILAPILPIPDPNNDVFPGLNRAGPSLDHLFGVDANGRDVLSRVIWGGRNSMVIGVFAILFGFIIGGIFGMIAGYFQGTVGSRLGGVTDILLAFPPLVLALPIVTFLERTRCSTSRSRWHRVGAGARPDHARVDALVVGARVRARPRAQGAKHRRIMVREVLPNVMPAMFSIALLGVAVVIVAEGGLAILGVGRAPPRRRPWGNIIAARPQRPADAAVSSCSSRRSCIFLTVLSLNYLGDVVRARFDVRESAL